MEFETHYLWAGRHESHRRASGSTLGGGLLLILLPPAGTVNSSRSMCDSLLSGLD
jgi:hypothetical protein